MADVHTAEADYTINESALHSEEVIELEHVANADRAH